MTSSGLSPSSQPNLAVSPIAYPLDEFYAQAGRTLPAIEAIDGSLMPEPYKSLLVHTRDMTSTLERFHKSKVHLQVLQRQNRNDLYFREVLLILDGSGTIVEFGAIKIHLASFPPTARREILEEKVPLGHILDQHAIPHTSRPKAYFRIEADEFIREVLRLPNSQLLFARRNTLADANSRPMAEIVEILPPAPAP